METIQLTEEIKVFGVKAASFPAGIQAAYEGLNALLNLENRTLFGISYMDKESEKVIYLAATREETEGEASQYKAETFLIPTGNYLSEKVENWAQNVPQIGETFQKLGESAHGTDFLGIEWYQGNDVLCLLKIK